MAISVTQRFDTIVNVPSGPPLRKRYCFINGDGAVASSFALAAADFKLTTLKYIEVFGAGLTGAGAGFAAQWDATAGKMKLYKSNGASGKLQEAAGADFTSTDYIECAAIGEL